MLELFLGGSVMAIHKTIAKHVGRAVSATIPTNQPVHPLIGAILFGMFWLILAYQVWTHADTVGQIFVDTDRALVNGTLMLEGKQGQK